MDDSEGNLSDEDAERIHFAAISDKMVQEWRFVKSVSSYAALDPRAAHIAYAFMALKYAMSGFLEGFRYRSATNYYDIYKIGDDFEWYKWGDKIRNYGFFVCYFILFVTSSLASLGKANDINILAWRLVGSAARGTSSLGRYLKNRDKLKAWSIVDENKSSEVNAAKAVLTATDQDFERDQLMDLGMQIVQFFAEESLTFE